MARREKVRRKRARKSSEDKKSSPPEPITDKGLAAGQQPDLVEEQSRDLPSGWQVVVF